MPGWTNPNLRRRRGFSIAELLVVVGVLVVLAGITITAVLKAKGSADAARLRSDLMAVGSALDQYANDFKGVYPTSGFDRNNKPIEDHVLAKALIGPGNANEDGVEGPGFRAVSGGRAYQPYLSPDKFKTRYIKDKDKWELCDSFG
ncbi:MAG: type II secretion system protein, partial [Bacillota bacterium]